MAVPKIFISYAHADIAFQKELLKRLKPLKRKKEIILWHDGVILPGEKWDSSIKENLAQANIIILLLSADFVDSDYIYEKELPAIIDRRERGDIQLIPIVVRNITLDGTNIGIYQCLPQDEFRQLKPIIEWEERQIDKVWLQIDQQIRAVIDRFNHSDKDASREKEIGHSSTQTLNDSSAKVNDLARIKKELKRAVVRDLGKALDKLDGLLLSDSSLFNSIIQLQAQHSQYKENEIRGTISQDNLGIQRARIIYAFQSLVDDLKTEDLA